MYVFTIAQVGFPGALSVKVVDCNGCTVCRLLSDWTPTANSKRAKGLLEAGYWSQFNFV